MAETVTSTSASPADGKTSPPAKSSKRSGVFATVGIVLFVLLLLAGFVYLFLAPATQTARVRDVVVILAAFMTLLIGLSLVILVIQIARLALMVKHEVKPILDSANETVNTLRGTSAFMSENLTEPVMKLNEYIAALKKLVDLLSLGRKKTS